MVDECLLDAQTMDVVFRYILLPSVLFAGWRAFSMLNELERWARDHDER